jgi:hypothetical protein
LDAPPARQLGFCRSLAPSRIVRPARALSARRRPPAFRRAGARAQR